MFQSSTLGYAPPRSIEEFDEESFDESEVTRQTSAALLMLDVAVGRFDAGTGVAPVTAMAEPLVEDVALDASQRTFPVGFAQPLGVTALRSRAAAVPAPRRGERRAGPGERVHRRLPAAGPVRVVVGDVHSTVPTDIAFGTSNPRVARFVAARRGSDSDGPRRPEIVLDASGHVVDDPRGVFCPLTAGATDVSVTTAGRRITTPIQVIELSLLDLPSEIKITPIAPGTCGFPDFSVTRKADKPAAAAPEKPAAPQRPAPLPIIPPPAQPHAPAPVHHAPPPRPRRCRRRPSLPRRLPSCRRLRCP